MVHNLMVEHRNLKKLKKKKKKVLHRLILWNVFFNMTHVLPLISAQTCDENALQNRRVKPVLDKVGSLTIPSQQAQLGPTSDFVGIRGLNWAWVLGGPFTWYGVGPTWAPASKPSWAPRRISWGYVG